MINQSFDTESSEGLYLYSVVLINQCKDIIQWHEQEKLIMNITCVCKAINNSCLNNQDLVQGHISHYQQCSTLIMTYRPLRP